MHKPLREMKTVRDRIFDAVDRPDEATVVAALDAAQLVVDQLRDERNRARKMRRRAVAERDRLERDWNRERDGRLQAEIERDRLAEQRDRARMAIHRADRLIAQAINTEKPLDAAALAEALEDVAHLCPACWRLHGLWCHPFGGPMADPDPTALDGDAGEVDG